MIPEDQVAVIGGRRGSKWHGCGDLSTGLDFIGACQTLLRMSWGSVDRNRWIRVRSASMGMQHEGGFLVTLNADLSEDEVDAVAQSIEEVSGVVTIRRYIADAGDRAAVELNDARWRESIVHLLDDEGV